MRAGGGVGWGLSRGELREASRKASHRHDEWLAQLEGRYRTIWWQRNKCESAAVYLSHDQPGDGAIGVRSNTCYTVTPLSILRTHVEREHTRTSCLFVC